MHRKVTDVHDSGRMIVIRALIRERSGEKILATFLSLVLMIIGLNTININYLDRNTTKIIKLCSEFCPTVSKASLESADPKSQTPSPSL